MDSRNVLRDQGMTKQHGSLGGGARTELNEHPVVPQEWRDLADVRRQNRTLATSWVVLRQPSDVLKQL